MKPENSLQSPAPVIDFPVSLSTRSNSAVCAILTPDEIDALRIYCRQLRIAPEELATIAVLDMIEVLRSGGVAEIQSVLRSIVERFKPSSALSVF